MPRIETIDQRTTPGGGLGAGPNARAQEVYNPARALASMANSVSQLNDDLEAKAEKKKAEEEKALQEAARYEGPVAAARAAREIAQYSKDLDEAGDYTSPAERTKKISEHANSVFARVQTENANNKFTQNYLKGQVGVDVVIATDDAVGYEAASNVIARNKLAKEAIDLSIANVASDPSQFDRHQENALQALASAIKDPNKFAAASEQLKAQFSQAYIATELSSTDGAKRVITSIDSYFGQASTGEKMSMDNAGSLLKAKWAEIGGVDAWDTAANNKFMELAMAGKGYNAGLKDGKVVVTEVTGGAELHPAYKAYMGDPTGMLTLRGKAEAVLNKAENENNDAKRAAAIVSKQNIQNTNAGIEAGDPSVAQAPYTDYQNALGNDTAAAIAYKEDSLRIAGMGKVQAMYGMDAAGRDAYVESLKPKEGQIENRAVAESIYESAVKANIQISQDIDKQPGDYVLQRNKQVQAAQEKFGEEPSLQNLGTFVAVAMDAQDKLGVKKKALPTGIVETISESFTSSLQNKEQGDAASGVAYLQGVSKVLANSPSAISQIVAKTGPEGLLAINGASLETVQLYQQAKAVPLATHEKQNGGEKLESKVMAVLAGMNKTWQAQGAFKTQESYAKAIELIAHARIANGEDADTAVKNAYEQAIGSQFEVWNKVRVPKQGAQQIKDGLDYVRQAVLSPESLFITPTGNAEVDKLHRETLFRTIKRNGYWVNDASGDGAYLMINNGEQVLDATGQRVYARFDSAAKRAKEAINMGVTEAQKLANERGLRQK